MVDMSQWKKPVHRSLLQREMLLGIPQAGMLILLALGLIFIYSLRLYFTAIPIALFYFVMRHFTRLDQWFIDILINRIKQPDKLIP